MKKHILILTAFSLLLTGCGKINTGNADRSGRQDSESLITDSKKTSERNDISVVENVQARTSSKNLFGDDLCCRIPDAKELYAFVTEVMDDSEKFDAAANDKILSVGFKTEEGEYLLSYSADDVFAWAERSTSEATYFKPDDDTAVKLRDMMIAYSALGYIFEDAEYTVGTEHIKTSYITDIAGSLPDPYCETRYYYLDDRRTTAFIIQTDGDALFYLQTTSRRTDAVIDDSPYYQDEEFYEYFTDGKGKDFYRPEGYDVFYPAEEFNGDVSPIPFPKSIIESDEYMYSFNIGSDSDDLTVEVWEGDDTTDYLLICNGELRAAWNFREGAGMTFMKAFRTEQVASGEIAEIIEHAEQHMAGDEGTKQEKKPKDNMEWLKYDTEKYGLFDLNEGVKIGQDVEPTGVVEEWRNYISSADKPFTLEFRWAGSGRNEHQISTTDGNDYYYRNDMEIHDGEDDLGGEEWMVDNRYFQSVYKTKEYPVREVTEYPLSDYGDSQPKLVTDLLFQNEKYNEDYTGKCERAYEVTIADEKYICEEWSLYLGRLWKVYIKDGNIVAWEGDFYDEPIVNTVIRLEKAADSKLIQVPKDAKLHGFDD